MLSPKARRVLVSVTGGRDDGGHEHGDAQHD